LAESPKHTKQRAFQRTDSERFFNQIIAVIYLETDFNILFLALESKR